MEPLCYAEERLNSNYSTRGGGRHVRDQGCTQDVAIFIIYKIYSPYKFIFSLTFVETRYVQVYLSWKVCCVITNTQTQGPRRDIKILYLGFQHISTVLRCAVHCHGLFVSENFWIPGRLADTLATAAAAYRHAHTISVS